MTKTIMMARVGEDGMQRSVKRSNRNTINGRLNGRSGIVTGASKGIGAAIATKFALEGANVLINYNKSKEQVADLVDSLKDNPQVSGKIIAYRADISNLSQIRMLVAKSLREFGRIDILVNNAGILISKHFLDVREKDYNKVMDVNLKGAFFLCQAVAPIMLRQRHGKIINISSVSALAQRSALTYADYVCSKTGMIGLTRSLAVILGPNINVNAICPGTVKTDMIAWMPERIMDSMTQESLLNRLGKPEDIATAALFLASDESDFITGEIITVAGGRGMR
jgi:3-oxoacyl-[acyl-carrier protein] reductase